MTPYVLKGWVGKWGSHGNYGKSLRDESQSICRESIDPNYIKRSFKKFKQGFYTMMKLDV